MGFQIRPIEPGDLVVLTVRIVVTSLRPTHFIAHHEHRYSLAEQQGRQHIFDLTNTNGFDVLLFAWAFDTVVVAVVVVVSISISLTVGIVVLVFVAYQIVHGKAVMGRHKVNATVRCSARLLVQIGGAAQASRHGSDHASVTAPVAPNVIAVATVPLCPTQIAERPDLVSTRSIPRFGDDFGVRQHRILSNQIHQRWVRHQVPVAIARKDARKIKSEPIDMVVMYPMSQAMENELAANRMVAIECVTATGVVAVVCSARIEDVVDLILKSFKGQNRAAFIAFAGMIENHVENHFDACLMQGLDHLLELLDLCPRFFGRCISSVRSKESHWVVSPIVWTLRRITVDVQNRELMNGHEFNCGDP